MPSLNAEEALAELYDAHADGLFAFLCARLKDADAAGDLLHDCFVAFFRQPDWRAIQVPKPYLYMTAQRLSLNYLRDRKKSRTALNEAAFARGWASVEAIEPAVFLEAREALAELTSEDRDVIVLRVYGSMTFQEIAETLGVGLATVHARYERGIKDLRKRLSGKD